MSWVVILALLPLEILCHGIVLLQLWGWFMVPLGLPDVGLAHVLGISTTVELITHQLQEKHGGVEYSSNWGMRIFMPMFILLTGWVLHLFMS